MTELERLAAAILAQWRTEGGAADAPIVVSVMLDRILPYRVARRLLGIDASEDYEALMLRLLAEEEGLVRVEPVDAADMARATIGSRLPDLDALQLLRAARVTFDGRAVVRLGDAAPIDRPAVESPRAAAPAAMAEEVAAPAVEAALEPVTAPVKDVTTKRKARNGPTGPAPRSTVPAPVAGAAECWSCGDALPADRAVKFCPFCGADQRQPTCAACGASADRGWKHCAECGAKL